MPDTAAKTPTILIIDDDSEIRYSLSRVLSSRKYQVIEAPSGDQARTGVVRGIAHVEDDVAILLDVDTIVRHVLS